jgi:hypothetical protein
VPSIFLLLSALWFEVVVRAARARVESNEVDDDGRVRTRAVVIARGVGGQGRGVRKESRRRAEGDQKAIRRRSEGKQGEQKESKSERSSLDNRPE